MAAYGDIKRQKYKGLDNEEELVENLNDKLAAIFAIYHQPNAQSIEDFGKYIDSLFSDEHSPITLSTCHRAKGLENERIFIVKPEDIVGVVGCNRFNSYLDGTAPKEVYMDELDLIIEENLESEESDLLPVRPDSPTPHYDKLQELLNNHKLPEEDKKSIRQALERYEKWIQSMNEIDSEGDEKVRSLVKSLNEYKSFVELEVIWDSEANFLYRQRGQLKLDNSIIEEFLPRLVDPAIIPALEGRIYVTGPRTTFSGAYFTSSLASPSKGAGLQIRKKDQDFTVSRAAYLQSSFDPTFPPDDTVAHKIHLAFVAAECKTNLDKTMFQGVLATAHDLKVAFPGSRYYLLCEWLDMTPISTRATDIDEVVILRGKRLQSNVRAKFARSNARREARDWYLNFLVSNPVREDRVLRFVNHMRILFNTTTPAEDEVLSMGYF